MSRFLRPSTFLLGSALALSALAAPAAAFADGTGDTTASVSVAEVISAVQAAQQPTAAADMNGWFSHQTGITGDPWSLDVTFAFGEGRALIAATAPELKDIVIDHKGNFESVRSFGDTPYMTRHVRRALAMLGRSDATWIWAPDKTVNLADASPDGLLSMAPDADLSAVAKYLGDPSEVTVTGTPAETTAADGSTTYVLHVIDTENGGPQKGTITLAIDPAGVLTELDQNFPGNYESLQSFAYGAQHVELPTADQVVGVSQVKKAMELLSMARDTRSLATGIADAARSHRGKHESSVKAIRSHVARPMRQLNWRYQETIFTSRNVPGGVRVRGTNPLTHEKVSYTVTAHRGKIVVRQS